jgi:hypothetical protein
MSNFFSCIVTRKAEVLFCELDAHDEIIYRSGLSDNLTCFLRVVYSPEEGYLVDSTSIPEWYEREAALIERKVATTYKRLLPIWRVYDKVYQIADGDFKAIESGAWSMFCEYKNYRRRDWIGYVTSKEGCEDDVDVQLRFDEFVGIEGGAYSVFKSAISEGLKKYKRNISVIDGFQQERKETKKKCLF